MGFKAAGPPAAASVKPSAPRRLRTVLACIAIHVLVLTLCRQYAFPRFNIPSSLFSSSTHAPAPAPPDVASVAPVRIDWSTYPRAPDSQQRTAAVYSPYHLTLGGGERYLLYTVVVLQHLGYKTDVIVSPGNQCNSSAQLFRVARALRIDLAQDTGFRIVVKDVYRLRMPERYDVFWTLGNEKIPQVEAAGKVALYMCQFPFDLNRITTADDVRRLSAYDYVLLNSQFSLQYYYKFATQAFLQAHSSGLLPPEPAVMYPPVQPYAACTGARLNGIVMLGRFFEGRQSKGHDIGIALFKRIQAALPPDTTLTLVGNLMPGHEAWLKHLRQLASGLPVQFVVSAPASEVQRHLCAATVLWHLTGYDVNELIDPASIEHFGLAVGEGMTAGLIPIVLNKGGVTEIVEHAVSGFRSNDLRGFGNATLRVLNYDSGELDSLRFNAMQQAARFNSAAFKKQLATLVHRGFLTKPFRHLVREASLIKPRQGIAAGVRTGKVAVLIEPRMHWALEFVCTNAVRHLGPGWMLHVFHGTANEQYVRAMLAHVANVRFTRLPSVGLTIPAYNQLLTSHTFWSSLRAQHVLTLQTDAVILRPGIDRFLQYDYVGAPWSLDNERWSKMHDVLPIGVGNGGFSLRRTAAMQHAIRHWGHTTNNTEQEDVFFSRVLQKQGFHVPTREVAYNFCVEVLCGDVRQLQGDNPPLALHAAWYYLSHVPDLLHALLEQAVAYKAVM